MGCNPFTPPSEAPRHTHLRLRSTLLHPEPAPCTRPSTAHNRSSPRPLFEEETIPALRQTSSLVPAQRRSLIRQMNHDQAHNSDHISQLYGCPASAALLLITALHLSRPRSAMKNLPTTKALKSNNSITVHVLQQPIGFACRCQPTQ